MKARAWVGGQDRPTCKMGRFASLDFEGYTMKIENINNKYIIYQILSNKNKYNY